MIEIVYPLFLIEIPRVQGIIGESRKARNREITTREHYLERAALD